MGGGSVTTTYEFDTLLAYSTGPQQATDCATLKAMFPGCVSVQKTTPEMDRTGVDYILTLRGGSEIRIDAKTRQEGASRFWTDGPELALEVWSVRPGGRYDTPMPQSKVGWTLCESKDVEYILFTFAPADCAAAYLFPYQLLRIAFRQNYDQWGNQHKTDIQCSSRAHHRWQSECIFVPVSVVRNAIMTLMEKT